MDRVETGDPPLPLLEGRRRPWQIVVDGRRPAPQIDAGAARRRADDEAQIAIVEAGLHDLPVAGRHALGEHRHLLVEEPGQPLGQVFGHLAKLGEDDDLVALAQKLPKRLLKQRPLGVFRAAQKLAQPAPGPLGLAGPHQMRCIGHQHADDSQRPQLVFEPLLVKAAFAVFGIGQRLEL